MVEAGFVAQIPMHSRSMGETTPSPTWAQPSISNASVSVACNKFDHIIEIHATEWKVGRPPGVDTWLLPELEPSRVPSKYLTSKACIWWQRSMFLNKRLTCRRPSPDIHELA